MTAAHAAPAYLSPADLSRLQAQTANWSAVSVPAAQLTQLLTEVQSGRALLSDLATPRPGGRVPTIGAVRARCRAQLDRIAASAAASPRLAGALDAVEAASNAAGNPDIAGAANVPEAEPEAPASVAAAIRAAVAQAPFRAFLRTGSKGMALEVLRDRLQTMDLGEGIDTDPDACRAWAKLWREYQQHRADCQ